MTVVLRGKPAAGGLAGQDAIVVAWMIALSVG